MASANRKFRHVRNDGFVCGRCGMKVRPLANGSSRNHCPGCLWSRHLDVVPGDRAANCSGLMEPVSVQHEARRGWMIVHRCTSCGAIRRNKAATGDPIQPDSFATLLSVAKEAVRADRRKRTINRERRNP